MLTGISPIRARTIGNKICRGSWKKRYVYRAKGLLYILRHLASQQFGREERLGSHNLCNLVPIIVREWLQLDFDIIRLGLRTLDLGLHHARFNVDRDHLSLPGIGATARQPRSQA